MPISDLGRLQRDAAKKRADRVRVARSVLLRGLGAGTLSLHGVLADPPDCIRSAPLHLVLRRTRFISDHKLRRLNVAAVRSGVNLFTPVGELTGRQVAWLLEHALPVISTRNGVVLTGGLRKLPDAAFPAARETAA